MLSPVPAATAARRHSPAASAGAEHRGDGRGPVPVGVDDRQEVVAVATVCRRPVPGARGVAAVGRQAAGHPEGQPVVRQHDVGQPRPRLRLATVQPRELGDREAGHGDQPAGLGPRLPATGELVDQPCRVGGRFGVVPQLGRPDHVAVFVERDQPVLLPGDADCRDGRRTGLLPGSLEGRPPSGRFLLRPWRLGRRVGSRAAPDDPTALEVAHLDLRRAGGGVDAGDQGHAGSSHPAGACRAGSAAGQGVEPEATGVVREPLVDGLHRVRLVAAAVVHQDHRPVAGVVQMARDR